MKTASNIQKSFSIGLSMIAKNEAPRISKAILSAKNFCSQIVIVDTGSEDSTASIGINLGAEVYFHSWQNDFSHARNLALNYMRTDWIIMLDADEIIDSETFSTALALIKDSNIGGIAVKILNYLGGENDAGVMKHKYTRIFRNLENIRFCGAIHEQVRDSIENAGLSVAESEAIFHHYGYSGNDPRKAERNRNLLINEMNKSPNDVWIMQHLAETEFAAGNLDKADKLFKVCLESDELPAEKKEMARIRIAQIALSRNDFRQTIEYTKDEIYDPDRNGFRLFIRAAALLNLRQFEEAALLYNSMELNNSAMVDKKVVQSAIIMLNKIPF